MSANFDSLSRVQLLERAGIERQAAEAHVELLRDVVVSEMATQEDLNREFDRFTEKVELQMKVTEQKITLRMGSMIAAGVAVLIAYDRFFG